MNFNLKINFSREPSKQLLLALTVVKLINAIYAL